MSNAEEYARRKLAEMDAKDWVRQRMVEAGRIRREHQASLTHWQRHWFSYTMGGASVLYLVVLLYVSGAIT